MSFKNNWKAALGAGLVALAAAITLASCGGGSSSSTTTTTTTTPVNNTAAAEVNAGPAGNSLNMLFVTVTVCMPGSTTNCQTINNVQVDTGSEGLRVLSSALGSLDPSKGNGSGLPTVNDSSGDVLQECVQFADTTYVWGPVATADVSIAGEKASSLPIHVISANPLYPVPSSCLSLGNGGDINTLQTLEANGIIGLGVFPNDCGGACTASSASAPDQYFFCPGGVCSLPTSGVPLNDQVTQPVVGFASDNNGIMITMPGISASGQASASGSVIFGIGTQSNNGLGSASVYSVDDTGSFTATYNGVQYPSSAFLDTGSTAFYFLDHTTLGIPDCSDYSGLYCPASTQNYTITNTALDGTTTTGQVTISIANTDSLLGPAAGPYTGFTALNDLGGDGGSSPSTDMVDYGMPFFYNRSVFVGIMGQSAPSNATNTYGYFAF